MDERANTGRHPLSPDVGDLRPRLAETYAWRAEALEQTARLTDEDADWEESQGRAASAGKEHAEAAGAWAAAARCRTNVQRLR
jgi:hypothetical protein